MRQKPRVKKNQENKQFVQCFQKNIEKCSNSWKMMEQRQIMTKKPEMMKNQENEWFMDCFSKKYRKNVGKARK
jgi:hypothetical protein